MYILSECLKKVINILWSEKDKKLILIELTVPWETRCEEAYERKKAKYTELVNQCKHTGWHTLLFPIEVGARGFCAQSICRLMTAIGTGGRDRRSRIQKFNQSAERSSIYIYNSQDGISIIK